MHYHVDRYAYRSHKDKPDPIHTLSGLSADRHVGYMVLGSEPNPLVVPFVLVYTGPHHEGMACVIRSSAICSQVSTTLTRLAFGSVERAAQFLNHWYTALRQQQQQQSAGSTPSQTQLPRFKILGYEQKWMGLTKDQTSDLSIPQHPLAPSVTYLTYRYSVAHCKHSKGDTIFIPMSVVHAFCATEPQLEPICLKPSSGDQLSDLGHKTRPFLLATIKDMDTRLVRVPTDSLRHGQLRQWMVKHLQEVKKQWSAHSAHPVRDSYTFELQIFPPSPTPELNPSSSPPPKRTRHIGPGNKE